MKPHALGLIVALLILAGCASAAAPRAAPTAPAREAARPRFYEFYSPF